MTLLNMVGFETGDLSELTGSSGSVSVQSTTKRTGSYALRLNPSGTASRVQVVPILATGAQDTTNGFGDGATVYATGYIRVASLPGSASTICTFGNSGTTGIAVQIDASGNVTIFDGTSSSASAGTVTADGNWHRLDLKYVDHGTCSIAVDGGTARTLAAASNPTSNFFYFGSRLTTVTYDIYFDDWVFDDASFATSPQIVRCAPDGNGTDATGFTGGTGSTYTEVDEVPHDSTTTQWSDSTLNDVRGVTLVSAASAGVVGTIAAVKALAIVKSTSTGQIATRVRSGSSTSDSTGFAPSTSYIECSKIAALDPATTAAWTSSGIDGAEVAVKTTNAAAAVQATSLMLMVLSDGVIPATVKARRSASLRVGSRSGVF